MRFGYHLGYWGAGPTPGAAEAGQAAEALGLDSVWTAEAYGSDAFTPLAWWGASTRRIRLGTAIAQISARTPTATAMAALTLDHLSGGRFVLGLGVSGPQVGAIAVMSRGRSGGHVGIITGVDARGNPIMISGNNGNRVREAPVSRGRIYAYVMPN